MPANPLVDQPPSDVEQLLGALAGALDAMAGLPARDADHRLIAA